MSLTIATGAIVCNESQLVGEISIGTRTVVHPKVCVKCYYKRFFAATYLLDVLCRQQIKLFQVVSTSEFHEY